MTPTYSFETFKDNNITMTSLENLGGHSHDHHQSLLLLDDIDQYLSEVTLPQPEPILPTPEPQPEPILPTPKPEYHHLDAPYNINKGYDLFQEGCGPTPIHTLPHEQEAEIKNVDYQATKDSRGKQPILEPERKDDPHHLQDSLKRRTQKRSSGNRRRRERINANIKVIQQLTPHCGKGNHATILERAIEYIKSLKFYIDAFSRSRSGQGQFQAPYATQMMVQPWPRMVHGIGTVPWPQGTNHTGYPTLNPILGQGGFGGGVQIIQPMSHGQVPFTPIFCRLPCYTTCTPIMSPPTPAVFPFVPPQSQSTPPGSFSQAPHF